ncbi:PREDICTED: beta-galactosidase 15-like [Camelina sativa]|uniref:Beta-galactosidase 15-like n=1 Tax=Camelina sativa TaxID=90675 RepID=A0ABM0YXF8_CAMSA|nr:PREDICTED: beta-galactosidase 15-like [Camelina sativa]
MNHVGATVEVLSSTAGPSHGVLQTYTKVTQNWVITNIIDKDITGRLYKSVRGPIRRLYCQDGYIITKINFADYGNPTGTCEHFRDGNCGAPATLRLVKKNCLGKKPKCVFLVTDEVFGPSHCKGPPTLAVDATCTKT